MTTVRDPAAFCEALSPRLVGSLVLFCGDRGMAEELAQEALARGFERWDQLETMQAPEAWVYRVAFNLARSGFRRRAAERRSLRRLAIAPSVDLPDSVTAVTVRASVAALPPRQRAAIVARFYVGFSVDEAAVALGCAPGTVRALTHQAMVRLRASGLGSFDDEVEEVDHDANAQ